MYRLLLAQNIDYHEDALEMKIANWTQRLLLVLGLLLVGIYVAAYFRGQIVSRTKLQRFEILRTRAGLETHEALLPKAGFQVDVSQWSKKRIAEYEESLAEGIDPPLA